MSTSQEAIRPEVVGSIIAAWKKDGRLPSEFTNAELQSALATWREQRHALSICACGGTIRFKSMPTEDSWCAAVYACMQCGLVIEPLPLGPRARRLERSGLLPDILWEERYPEQEKPPGRFGSRRLWLESASVEEILDLWCRGQNLIRFAGLILSAVDGIRKAVKS